MRIDRVLILLGATVLIVAVAFTAYRWFPATEEGPPEVPEPIAMLIAGAIALISLVAASYLAIQELKEVRYRRAKPNEGKGP